MVNRVTTKIRCLAGIEGFSCQSRDDLKLAEGNSAILSQSTAEWSYLDSGRRPLIVRDMHRKIERDDMGGLLVILG